MKRQEVLKFLQKIKVYYPSFSTDGQMVKDEWTRKLEPYDFDDCCMKLDEHLAGEYQDRPPMPNWIIKYLKTSEEKKHSYEYYTVCPTCNVTLPLAHFEKHIRKCNSIEYVIKEMKKYFGQVISREKLEKLPEEQFWGKYNLMLQRIKAKLPSDFGKKKLIQAYFGEIDLSKDDLEKAVANGYEEEMEK